MAASTPSQPAEPAVPVAQTALPTIKIAIIASVNMVNSVSYLMAYPFVPFLVMELLHGLGANEVGFYSGMIEGAFHVGAFCGSMPWGWFSDTAGRRPALLLGLLGTAVCCVLFGFSRSFGMALAVKFFWGALNSTVGVASTYLSELTDNTNSARAFSYFGVGAGVGRLIGPSIGGLLSEPAKRFPAQFDTPFWRQFPYLLPCSVGGLMALGTLVAAYVSLGETLKKPLPPSDNHGDAALPDDIEARHTGAETEHEFEKHRLLEYHHRETASRAPGNDKILENDAPSMSPRHELEFSASASHAPHQILGVPAFARRKSQSSRASSPSTQAAGDMQSTLGLREEVADEQSVVTPSAFAQQLRRRISEDAIELVHRRSSPARAATRAPADMQPYHRTAAEHCRRAIVSIVSCGGSMQLLGDPAVRVSTVLYMLLSLQAIVGSETFPLYALNDAKRGGFGWTSADIGFIATLCGPSLIIYQTIVYNRLVKWMGVVRLARVALALGAMLTAMTPLCSLTIGTPPALQWTVMTVHFSINTISRMTSFTCMYVFIANSALPADRGKVNGLAQALASAMRAIGPAAGTAIFAWSVSDANTALGWPWNFHFTFYILGLIVLTCLALTYALPPWIASKREAAMACQGRN